MLIKLPFTLLKGDLEQSIQIDIKHMGQSHFKFLPFWRFTLQKQHIVFSFLI